MRASTADGTWLYANVFTGPGLCPTTAAQVGWLSAASTWVDGALDEATLAPMVLTGNCNGGNLYDPVPINETDGFNNRGASGYLYNSSEQPHTGYAVCSTNDL